MKNESVESVALSYFVQQLVPYACLSVARTENDDGYKRSPSTGSWLRPRGGGLPSPPSLKRQHSDVVVFCLRLAFPARLPGRVEGAGRWGWLVGRKEDSLLRTFFVSTLNASGNVSFGVDSVLLFTITATRRALK